MAEGRTDITNDLAFIVVLTKAGVPGSSTRIKRPSASEKVLRVLPVESDLPPFPYSGSYDILSLA
jgi:hypothetical protein